MNSQLSIAPPNSVNGSADGVAKSPAKISTSTAVGQQPLAPQQLPDRRCFAVLAYLMQYRSLNFVDLFLLRQEAVGTCSFKDPENVLKQNSCFNFRDAFTRELSVNLVASLNEPARYGTPGILRRPWFDIERVEIPAHTSQEFPK